MRRYLRPREGSPAFLLLVVMPLSLGAALQASGWLPHAGFAVPLLLAAGVAGAVLALSPRRSLLTIPVGAVLGGGAVTAGRSIARGRDELADASGGLRPSLRAGAP